jgi:elongation factor G
MKDYGAEFIRNVVLLGHGGAGKTTLAESMLFLTGGTDRFGSVTDGNTVMDFDPEATRRNFSISTAVAPVEWDGCKINLIDTPGYFDFVGEQMQGLAVADGALILAGGKDGLQVGTEKAWAACVERKIPHVLLISKIDEENSDFKKVFSQLKDTFGKSVIALEVPIFEDGKEVGVINVATMKAALHKGKDVVQSDIPEKMLRLIEEYREGISEAVAETDEALMEKYFAGEAFSEEEIVKGLHDGITSGEISPVLCVSAVTTDGVRMLMDAIVKYFPAHAEKGTIAARTVAGEPVALKTQADEVFSALVFKTVVDAFVGRISFLKVMSGTLKPDSVVYNPKKDKTEKIAQVFYMKGKQQIAAEKLVSGDIGVVTKLAVTETNDTLCTKEKPVLLSEIVFPNPMLAMAVLPKSKGDEDKIGTGLHRLMDEDQTFRMELNTETHQTLLYGVGDQHLDVIVSKLRNKFKTEVDLTDPIVPFRETIRKKVRVEGKHKKQSGGHGQFGDVWIEFEPGDEEGLTFEEKVVGGAVPKQYFPAVEKGLLESMQHGVLAGYPVVHLKATLVDGKYHDVDSSEMAVKIAASLAYKEGLRQASPVMLEPVASVEVFVPDAYMGDVIGDMNKRRGRIMGMTPQDGGIQQVSAEVPVAEMFKYATELRSMTQGRGWYDQTFARYDEAPANIAEKVIAEAAKHHKEEKDEG